MLVDDFGTIFHSLSEVPANTVVRPLDGYHEDDLCEIEANSRLCNIQFDLSRKVGNFLVVGENSDLFNVVVHSPIIIHNICKIVGTLSEPIRLGLTDPWYANDFLRRTVILDNVKIDKGTTISTAVLIGSNTTIGKRCFIGAMTHIEQFVTIEDHVRIDRKCFVDKMVKIESESTIGMGSSIYSEHIVHKKSSLGPNCVLSSDYSGVDTTPHLEIPYVPDTTVGSFFQLLPPVLDYKPMVLVMSDKGAGPFLVFDNMVFNSNQEAIDYCNSQIRDSKILPLDKRVYMLAKNFLEGLSKIEEVGLFDNKLLSLWIERHIKARKGGTR